MLSFGNTPRGLALIFPIAIFTIMAFFAITFPFIYKDVFDGELGIVENFQVIILFATIIFGIRIIAFRQIWPGWWFGWWVLVILLACLFALGEEINWGQIYFGWETPSFFKSINKQGETNFHNATSWLNFKPRALVEAAIIFGGLCYPFWQRRSRMPLWAIWIMPTMAVVPSAALTLVTKVTQYIVNNLGLGFPDRVYVRHSEVQEVFIYYFILIYLVDLHNRIVHSRTLQPAKPKDV